MRRAFAAAGSVVLVIVAWSVVLVAADGWERWRALALVSWLVVPWVLGGLLTWAMYREG